MPRQFTIRSLLLAVVLASAAMAIFRNDYAAHNRLAAAVSAAQFPGFRCMLDNSRRSLFRRNMGVRAGVDTTKIDGRFSAQLEKIRYALDACNCEEIDILFIDSISNRRHVFAASQAIATLRPKDVIVRRAILEIDDLLPLLEVRSLDRLEFSECYIKDPSSQNEHLVSVEIGEIVFWSARGAHFLLNSLDADCKVLVFEANNIELNKVEPSHLPAMIRRINLSTWTSSSAEVEWLRKHIPSASINLKCEILTEGESLLIDRLLAPNGSLVVSRLGSKSSDIGPFE